MPIGLIGIWYWLLSISIRPAEHQEPIDGVGFVLSGSASPAWRSGLSVVGAAACAVAGIAALIVGGAVAMTAYLFPRQARAGADPRSALLRGTDVPRQPGRRLSFRIGIGAVPFLLPLMLQLGFGMTPFQSGHVTFAAAVGAIRMKTVASRTISRFGFRNVLLVNAFVSSAFIAACAIFTPGMPVAILIAILLVGGFFRALEFTAINAIAYADIDPPRMSRATALASVGQQLSISTGVAVGALMVEWSLRWHGSTTISASDFTAAFLVVAVISGSSAFLFWALPADAGAEMSGHTPAAATKAEPIAAGETSDQRMG